MRGNGSVRAHYYGVIRELDKQLGRLFTYIRNNPELKNNTLIVLASDNGPSPRIGSSGGLRGRKGNLYEGGIREPFIIWAQGMMKEENTGKVNTNTILAGMDLPPSLLSIAGVQPPDSVEFDGLDMSEVFLGNTDQKRKHPVFWVRPPDVTGPNNKWPDLAVREGKWKLLVNIDGNNPELYNIERNPGETINLADQHPQTVSELRNKILSWFSKTSSSSRPWK